MRKLICKPRNFKCQSICFGIFYFLKICFIQVHFFFAPPVLATELIKEDFRAWERLYYTGNLDGFFKSKHTYKFSKDGYLSDIVHARKSFAKDQSLVCSFPARVYLLVGRNNTKFESLLSPCPKLREYLEKVPFETVSLAFASEQASQPASAMGHLFLRLRGQNAVGEDKDFGLSFITPLNTFNIPELAFGTLVSGRNGIVALNTFEDLVDNYVDTETRNIWETQINLSEAEKRLLQLHIWEIKSAAPLYQFIRYNCATFILRLLSAISSDLRMDESLFVTPLDVYRHFARQNQGHQTIYPSDIWLERKYFESIGDKQANSIRKRLINSERPGAFYDLTGEALDYAAILNARLAKANTISEIQEFRNLQEIRKVENHFTDQEHFKEVYSPVSRKPDSQLSLLAHSNEFSKTSLIRYLPAAFTLIDNQGDKYTRRESRLGEVVIEIDGHGKTKLDSLVIAAFKSITPDRHRIQKLSWSFYSGFSRSLKSQKLEGQTELFLGKATATQGGIVFYGLLGAGYQSQQKDGGGLYQGVTVGVLGPFLSFGDLSFEARVFTGAAFYNKGHQDINLKGLFSLWRNLELETTYRISEFNCEVRCKEAKSINAGIRIYF